MKCILHGVGRLILKDYTDKTKVIAHSDLQQFTLESTYSADDITGGNKLFPIASFKKDQALNCTAKDATFNDGISKYLDGGDVKTGAVTLTDFLEVTIPDDGVVDLGVTPTNVSIDGFTKVESSPTKGSFKLDTTKVTFDSEDAGQTVTIVYDYQSGAEAKQTSITQKSMAKPFEAVYIFDIYDEDTQIVAKGTVYGVDPSTGKELESLVTVLGGTKGSDGTVTVNFSNLNFASEGTKTIIGAIESIDAKIKSELNKLAASNTLNDNYEFTEIAKMDIF